MRENLPDLEIQSEELCIFLSILLLSGCIKATNSKMGERKSELVLNVMSRDRFLTIKRSLHFWRTSNEDELFWKLRPLIQFLQQRFMKHFLAELRTWVTMRPWWNTLADMDWSKRFEKAGTFRFQRLVAKYFRCILCTFSHLTSTKGQVRHYSRADKKFYSSPPPCPRQMLQQTNGLNEQNGWACESLRVSVMGKIWWWFLFTRLVDFSAQKDWRLHRE